MSKYLEGYEIYEEMILEITKQRGVMIAMRFVWVLDDKKVTYELSGPIAKVGAPEADNDSSNPPENVHKMVFLLKIFDWNILHSYHKLINKPFLIILMNTRQQNIYKNMYGSF